MPIILSIMRPTPQTNLFKNQPTSGNHILENLMSQQMQTKPNMPTQIHKPRQKPIQPGFKMPNHSYNSIIPHQSMKNFHSNPIHQMPICQTQIYQMSSKFLNKPINPKSSIQTNLNPKQMSSANNLSSNHSQVWSKSNSIGSNHINVANQYKKNKSILPNSNYLHDPFLKPQYSFNPSIRTAPIQQILHPNEFPNHQFFNYSHNNVFSNHPNSTINGNLDILNLLLLSSFPLLTPKDKIYLPVINRLQNPQTKKRIHELYVNLKFLLVQPDEIFWKYLNHLHESSLYGLTDTEVFDGNKLRLALQSCLANFTVKEFNKCISYDQLLLSQTTLMTKIYQFEDSKSFEFYNLLFIAVFEFYQRIMKTTNQDHIQIIIGSWYIDTVKIIELSMIYGNKEYQKVKKMVRDMFALRQAVFNHDFSVYIKLLHQYIDSSATSKDNDQISLMESLTKKIYPKDNRPSATKSNFKDFEKYSIRQIFYLCSQSLKVLMIVTNIFKFFPSHCILMVMENVDFIRSVFKIAIRVIFNLREDNCQENRRWRIPKKYMASLKNMEFILMDKIAEMIKVVFYVAKKSLDFQVHKELADEMRSKQDLRELKNKIRFYKRIIETTANRKKYKHKESYSNEQNQKNPTKTTRQNIDPKSLKVSSQIPKAKIRENELKINKDQVKNIKNRPIQSDLYNDVEFLSEDTVSADNDDEFQEQKPNEKQFHEELVDQMDILKRDKKIETIFESQKNTPSNKEIKKQFVSQESYGRILLKYILRKQLKKDFQKYKNIPYFYTDKLYDYCRQEYEAYRGQQKHNSSNESIQHTYSFEGLYKFIKVLADFQVQVRREYAQEMNFNKKYRKLDIVIRKLPTFSLFKLIQQRRQLKELIQKLNVKNKEYQDDPNEEQEIQIYWDNLHEDQDFTNLEQYFNLTKQSINFNKKSQSQIAQNQSQQLFPVETIDFDDGFNVPSMTSIDTFIFKPHESLPRVTSSMIKQEIETFQKYKNLNWHEISRVSFLKEQKNVKKLNSSKDSSLMQYNDMIKVADIGLSFDMELAIGDQEDESKNINKLSHFYYMDKKRKSFMDDYSFEERQQIEEPQEDQEDQIMQEEENQQSKSSRFRKNVKVMYVQKPLDVIEPSGKVTSMRIATGGMNSESFSRDYGGNIKHVNDYRNYVRQPYTAQNPYPTNQYPQYQYMAHPMMTPMQQPIQLPITVNHSVNYGNGHHYQGGQIYNQVLPANISALNLSHQQSLVNSFNYTNQMQHQINQMNLLNQQKNMDASQFSSSNRSFNYENYAPGPKNNVLNRTGGSKK